MQNQFPCRLLCLVGVILAALLAVKSSTAFRSPEESSAKDPAKEFAESGTANDESTKNENDQDQDQLIEPVFEIIDPAAIGEAWTPLQEPESAISPEVLAEIMEIRRLQNDLPQGTPLENPAEKTEKDDAFLKALKKIAEQSEPPKRLRENPISVSSDETFHAPPFNDLDLKESEDESLAEILRWTGRQLDLKANQLEDRKQPQRADELRNLSQRIRLEARRFEQEEPIRQARYLEK